MTTATIASPQLLEKTPRAPLGRLLRSELRWVLRRPRTLAALGVLALVPIGLGVLMSMLDLGGAPLQGPPVLASLLGNGMVLPLAAMTMAMPLLMPMIVSMTAADAIAGESSHGTLRGLLIAPIGRTRLVAVKAVGVAAVTAIAVAVLALLGITAGVVFTGTTEFTSLSGTSLTFAEGIGRVGVAAAWVWLQMFAVAAVALALSSFTDHPLVVLAVMMGSLIVFAVLGGIADLSWLHPVLLTTGWTSVIDVIRDPMETTTLVQSGVRALCYIVIGLSATVARMATKDS
ncbi:ABC transporter permease subunit [Allokutzneria albata]|uniref:ABC-2 type transport system permease protein n=1 Tax=Allokutzneria albata TaxID=211114 RepID=A0A1G9YKU1_ALLAB|nr:ABC transporter permease subunit [Allokutzneria albata]SDN09778.1 ABC-2 type transport system permease protein [Allokutzneria albata]